MRIPLPSLGENFHAADSGHAKVGNDRVEPLPLQGNQGFFTIVCGRAMESWSFQEKAEQLESSGLIIDNEHVGGRPVIR
jgi:hypothetical protein